MAKYDDLIKDYADEIAEIKRLGTVYNKTSTKEAGDNWTVAVSRLMQDIEQEYDDVPFEKPRQQGIERFWELANI